MSKLLAFLAGAVCLVWILAWTFWFKGKTAEQIPQVLPAKLSITLSDGTFQYTGLNVFHFNLSDAVAMVGDGKDSFFVAVANHLNQNPHRELLLTGTYLVDETNSTRFDNLGIARAEALKLLLYKAGASVDRIMVEGLVANNIIQTNGQLINAVSFKFREKQEVVQTPAPAEEQEVERPVYYTSKDAVTLRYPKNKFNLYDVGGRVVQILDSLRNHVMNRPTSKLVVTGFSEIAEEAATSFNLAEYRAMAVRRYLVDTGLEKRQVVVRFNSGVDGPTANSKVQMHVE